MTFRCLPCSHRTQREADALVAEALEDPRFTPRPDMRRPRTSCGLSSGCGSSQGRALPQGLGEVRDGRVPGGGRPALEPILYPLVSVQAPGRAPLLDDAQRRPTYWPRWPSTWTWTHDGYPHQTGRSRSARRSEPEPARDQARSTRRSMAPGRLPHVLHEAGCATCACSPDGVWLHNGRSTSTSPTATSAPCMARRRRGRDAVPTRPPSCARIGPHCGRSPRQLTRSRASVVPGVPCGRPFTTGRGRHPRPGRSLADPRCQGTDRRRVGPPGVVAACRARPPSRRDPGGHHSAGHVRPGPQCGRRPPTQPGRRSPRNADEQGTDGEEAGRAAREHDRLEATLEDARAEAAGR